MDYLEAYGQRLERNHNHFLKMAEELKSRGCKVFASKDGLINFIKVFKGDKHIIFGFGEVPYHWYLQICFKPSIKTGSGRTIETVYGVFAEELTVDYIISKMVSNPDVKDFTNPNYLQEI